MHRLQELVRLHRMNKGNRKVARVLQIAEHGAGYRRALEADFAPG